MKQAEVRVPCPSGQHPDHAIFIAPTISLPGAIEAERAMLAVDLSKPKAEVTQDLTYAWAPIFVRHGAIGWDLCDEAGNERPFDVEAVIADYSLARLVSNKADELGYGTAVIAPLLERQSKPSRNGRTPATTSATRPQIRALSASR